MNKLVNCVFCNPSNSTIFLEEELVYAKWDEFPVSNGHALIIPKRHISDFFGATIEERIFLLKMIDDAKLIIDEKYNPDGYNIGVNCGIMAGQSVMHLHMHMIPRYKGDVENPHGGIRGVIPEKQNY